MRWPWRTKREIEAMLPMPKVSPEQWARLDGTIQKARIVSYDEMDDASKAVWDEHMTAQRERFK